MKGCFVVYSSLLFLLSYYTLLSPDLDFAVSWVANIRKQGITGYLVGAMDDDLLK